MYTLKTLLIGLLIICTTGVGFAQRMNAEQRALREVAQLTEVISDLSETQKEQLQEANLKQFYQIRDLRQQTMAASELSSEDKEAARMKMKTLQKKKDEAYKKILNEDQYAKYTEWNDQDMKKGRRGKGYSRGRSS